MAITLLAGVDLRSAVSRACDINQLCGLNPDIDKKLSDEARAAIWEGDDLTPVVDSWYITDDYANDPRENRAPTEKEVQDAADTLAVERDTAATKKAADAAELVAIDEAIDRVGGVLEKADEWKSGDIDATVKDLVVSVQWLTKMVKEISARLKL